MQVATNKDRAFKYTEANIDTLAQVIAQCRTKTLTRHRLFQWLVFNVLVGNGDNHLKNLSFLVTGEGIEMSPSYDLLSTAVYTTKALAQENALWPNVTLAMHLPNARLFSQVSRQVLIDTGLALGMNRATTLRELDRQLAKIKPAAVRLIDTIQRENASLPAEDHTLGSEGLVIRSITYGIITHMVAQLQ